jgi:hypothetical protein
VGGDQAIGKELGGGEASLGGLRREQAPRAKVENQLYASLRGRQLSQIWVVSKLPERPRQLAVGRQLRGQFGSREPGL